MRSVYISAVALVAIVYACSSPDGSSSQGSKASSAAGEGDGGTTGQTSDSGTTTSPARIALVVERKDIVSSQPGALAQDTDLKNAWGLAFGPTGAAWVSANGSGSSAIYDEEGKHLLPNVTVPVPAGGTPPSAPTGQVFNGTSGAFKGDLFIFVTEDGTISGWQRGNTAATLRVDNSASQAVYKGVTLAAHSSGQRLYATNFRNGTIEVYDSTYARVDSATGAFEDGLIPAGFSPFNVKQIGGALFVTFAKQDDTHHDDVKGAGFGYVDVFDLDGALMARLVEGGALNAPWGLALAPKGYGALSGRLLVGNFGDGMINAYKYNLSGTQRGKPAVHDGVLGDAKGDAIVIDGLWALEFGNGADGFGTSDLYFTAGPNGEADGVFGELDAKGQTTTQ